MLFNPALLSGCASFSSIIIEEAPLSKTLDEVKEELRAFKYALEDVNEKGEPNLQFACDGNSAPVSDVFEIEKIKVTVSVEDSKNTGVEGGIVVASALNIGGGKSGAETNTNKLALNVVPEEIPADANAKMSKNGIGASLLAVVDQIAKTNNSKPCLKGAKSTLTLGFEIEKNKDVEGEIDLVVFSIGGEKSKSKTYSNDIEVTFNFGTAVFLNQAPQT